VANPLNALGVIRRLASEVHESGLGVSVKTIGSIQKNIQQLNKSSLNVRLYIKLCVIASF
jgi:hypothetical protein